MMQSFGTYEKKERNGGGLMELEQGDGKGDYCQIGLQYRFHDDSKLNTGAKETWGQLVSSRNDFFSYPGYVLFCERGSWLAESAKRIKYLTCDLRWYGAIWKREMEQRLSKAGLLANEVYFAVEGVIDEISRQITELNKHQDYNSTAKLVEITAPLDTPITIFSTKSGVGPANQVVPTFDWWKYQQLVLDRLSKLNAKQEKALQTFKETSREMDCEKLWLPLGTAAILEKEKAALRRYLLWLREQQTETWLRQLA